MEEERKKTKYIIYIYIFCFGHPRDQKLGVHIFGRSGARSLWFGRPDVGRQVKKKCKGHFGHHLSHLMPSGLEDVPEDVLGHNTSFLGILEREVEASKGENWKTGCWLEKFHL